MDSTVEHHKRREYCTTRLRYRQGRQLKAVKVYTVANESQHLLVFGVPKINLQTDLKRSLQRFGIVKSIECATAELVARQMNLEAFTDVFHVKYKQIEHARRAKRLMDAREFYGGILHISYAPEYESLEELRHKFRKRQSEVEYRLRLNGRSNVEPGHMTSSAEKSQLHK